MLSSSISQHSNYLLQRLLNRLRRINKLLQHLIQACQIILPLPIIRDQTLLLLQQHQSLLLQCFALCMLMFDPCDGECYFVGFGMLREEGEEFLDGDEW